MVKILLLCSAGMSTSIIAKKVQKEGDSRGLELEVNALNLEDLQSHINDYDVFLLGPQVKFKLADLKVVADRHNKPIDVIGPVEYGLQQGDKILDQALALIEKTKK